MTKEEILIKIEKLSPEQRKELSDLVAEELRGQKSQVTQEENGNSEPIEVENPNNYP